MKKINLIIMLLATLTMSAQSVTEITYLDVPATKIGKFVELHKTITEHVYGRRKNSSRASGFTGTGMDQDTVL